MMTMMMTLYIRNIAHACHKITPRNIHQSGYLRKKWKNANGIKY